jgi:hypothetical protein
VASARDRGHFDRIAAAEREAERESIEAAAARSPGENVELGLELSDFAAAFGGDTSSPDDVAPVRLWRARRQARSRQQ